MAQYGYNQPGYSQDNPYAQQAGNPYSQQSRNPYAQQGENPYDQRGGNPYGTQTGNPYAQQSANPYSQQQHSQAGGYGGPNDVEMGQMNGRYTDREQEKPLLDRIKKVENEILKTGKERIPQLKIYRRQILDDPNASVDTQLRQDYVNYDAATLKEYKAFAEKIDKLKATPGAGDETNRYQMSRLQGIMKKALEEYNKDSAVFDKDLKDQSERQLRTINPDITEQEVREAQDRGVGQLFQQQLLQTSRTGQSRMVLNSVNDRHLEIQRIEKQIQEVAELFEQVARVVQEQEVQVERIDQQAEETGNNVKDGNDQLLGGIKSARAARNKKFWCLGIIILILIIIAIILAIVIKVVLNK